ncbi:MAG: prolyl oligopeptidase family serine peptidase [Ilumatobacteraceae bacterium]
MSDSFPRQYARTQRLTLGEPRNLTVVDDGRRVLFARSRAGDDPVNCLWVVDIDTGDERLLVDPVELLDARGDDVPPEERARRERLREGAGGITSYALSTDESTIVFTLAGRLFALDLPTQSTRPVPVDGPVFDPRPSSDGALIAFVRGADLVVTDHEGHATELATDPSDTVSWGSAEFIAAEEMGRYRGFWWAPDDRTIAACRVDVAAVEEWHIANPADPASPAQVSRYPAAGTSNADVTMNLLDVADGAAVDIEWDRDRFPYLAAVDWNEHGLAVTVQSRDQRDVELLVVDPANGRTQTRWADHDDVWVELVPGAGTLVGPDTAVMCADRDGGRRLVVGDDVVSPPDVQVRSIVDAHVDRVVVTGNPLDDATVLHVYVWTASDFDRVTTEPGVHGAVVGGEAIVIRSATVDEPGGRWRLPSGRVLGRCGETPLVEPNVFVTAHSASAPATAVLLPHGHDGSPLPVLVDPYGGPHAQRVVRSHQAFCASQWFADQGFAVVIVDGRGTPGRGTDMERAVAGDLATGVLDDQVAGLHAAAQRHPEIDLDRVAIRGWSFGGYLAALAVLQRPDVFHTAIAGAPVTEWRLYDTHYTERYLGDPTVDPDAYDRSSLLPLAAKLTRPLLLIHGLADDNVVAAHTLQLSAALLAAGKPHEVLPLVGVTHMTLQEEVAENLLLHQLDFLRRSLPIGATH